MLRNRCDITKATDIERLNAALELNSDLSTAYYLKEESKLIWMCDDKKQTYRSFCRLRHVLKSNGKRRFRRLKRFRGKIEVQKSPMGQIAGLVGR